MQIIVSFQSARCQACPLVISGLTYAAVTAIVMTMKYATFHIRLVLVLILLASVGCNHWPWKTRHRRAVENYVTAITYRNAAQNQDAINELQEAVRLDFKFSLAHSMLGDLYRQNGQLDQAAAAYENACKLDPWAFKDHFSLGQVYQSLKKFSDAIRVLKRACQIQPNHPQVNYTLGICYYETGDYDQAKVFCGRAVELEPNDPAIQAGLGDVFNKTGDDYKAINAYKQALELNPNDDEVMVRLGHVYTRMKRFEPAKLILEKAIKTAPEKPKPYLAMAFCYLSEGQLGDAHDKYQAVIKIDPKNCEALNGIGVVCMTAYVSNHQDLQKAQVALESWHRSLEINPDQPKIKRLVAKYTSEIRGINTNTVEKP